MAEYSDHDSHAATIAPSLPWISTCEELTELFVAKDDFKFNAAHFVVLEVCHMRPPPPPPPPSLAFPLPKSTYMQHERELLHGHSYKVSLALCGKVDPLGYLVSFTDLKQVMREVCSSLDGRFLLPSLCPFLTAKEENGQVTLNVNDGSHFSFPAKDVLSLPIANVTVELLARHICQCFVVRAGASAMMKRQVVSVTIGVSETQGQEARFTVRFTPGTA